MDAGTDEHPWAAQYFKNIPERMKADVPNQTKPRNPDILPVAEQSRNQLYAMSIRFKADAGIRSMDELLDMCFPGERASLKDGLTLRITQTIPFIPDVLTLEKYAAALQDGYERSNNKIRLSNIRFDGYDYLYAVRPETEQINTKPCKHLKNGVCATGASNTGVCRLPCSHYETES